MKMSWRTRPDGEIVVYISGLLQEIEIAISEETLHILRNWICNAIDDIAEFRAGKPTTLKE
jgi:hypothetical protein